MHTPIPPPDPDRPSRFEPPAALRDRWPWLTWAPLVPPLIWLLWPWHDLGRATLPLFVLTIALLAFNAVRFFPLRETPARRRIALALLILVPPVLALASGPFGLMDRATAITNKQLFDVLQDLAMAGAFLVPMALLLLMTGGRRFVVFSATVAFLATFLLVAIGSLIVEPGS